MIVIGILGLLIAAGFAVWRLARRTGFFLHLLQLEGYKRHEYTGWIGQNGRGLIIRISHLIGAAVLIVAALLILAGLNTAAISVMLVSWPIAFASSRRYRRSVTKKPLVMTARMRRLVGVVAFLAAIVALAPVVWVSIRVGQGPPPRAVLLTAFFAGLGLADLLSPLLVWVSALLLSPVESRIHDGFKDQARATIASRPDLLVVAITGSYGKTSTKGAVASVLGHRMSVLATPGSYNTPMGLCRVINTMLARQHQALVLEMGMRYPGDIQELCDLVTPHIGIVTNVGVAHLETMGSREAIAREKGTLVENLPASGIAILNADDAAVLAMRERTRARVVTVGINERADIRAEHIAFGADGTSFDVIDDEGDRASFTTEVLGLHNVMNILFAIAVGRTQGFRLRAMAHAVKGMPPVEHRLKLRSEGDILVLDDAFNSNPVGARNAVDVLSRFDSGKRIIITPGMVELGDRQDEENRAFGAYMADRIDVALLVGHRQSKPIRDGLLSSGFSEAAIHTFASLADAQNHLRTIQRAGDIVLYENDLPDHYEEAA